MSKAILKKYETEIYPFKVWVAIAQDRDDIFGGWGNMGDYKD